MARRGIQRSAIAFGVLGAVALLAAGAACVFAVPRAAAAPAQQVTVVSADPVSSAILAPARFDAVAAFKDIKALAKIGVRRSGTKGERRGAAYIVKHLRALGYSPEVRTFKLPNGHTSRNVVARASGESTQVIVLGAHMDSKKPSPGANDNASGCAALLEIARDIAGRPLYADVEFVFFGAEEMVDRMPNHHHFGSRRYVSAMTASEREAVAAMISVDMIGVGSKMVSRTMGLGPRTLSDLLVSRANAAGYKLSYLRDRSTIGYSDHEAFERIGIPVSWIEWRDDPRYHTARDTAKRVRQSRVRRAGQVVLDFVLDADESMLASLR